MVSILSKQVSFPKFNFTNYQVVLIVLKALSVFVFVDTFVFLLEVLYHCILFFELPLIQHHHIHKLHLNIWTPSVKSGLRHRGAGHSYLNMSNIMQSLHRFFLRRTFTMKVTFVDHAYYLYDHSGKFIRMKLINLSQTSKTRSCKLQ